MLLLIILLVLLLWRRGLAITGIPDGGEAEALESLARSCSSC